MRTAIQKNQIDTEEKSETKIKKTHSETVGPIQKVNVKQKPHTTIRN